MATTTTHFKAIPLGPLVLHIIGETPAGIAIPKPRRLADLLTLGAVRWAEESGIGNGAPEHEAARPFNGEGIL